MEFSDAKEIESPNRTKLGKRYNSSKEQGANVFIWITKPEITLQSAIAKINGEVKNDIKKGTHKERIVYMYSEPENLYTEFKITKDGQFIYPSSGLPRSQRDTPAHKSISQLEENASVNDENNPSRASLTPEERRAQLLEETEDTARDDQIVLFMLDGNNIPSSIELDERSLVGLHNLSEAALKHTVKMGGLANPSMAVVDTNKQGFNNFGAVTLIAPKTLIAKDTGNNAGTYGADIYSPRYPSITREITNAGRNTLKNIFSNIIDENFRARVIEKTIQKFEGEREPVFEYTLLPVSYLIEKGNNDFWKYDKTKYSDEVKNQIKNLKSEDIEDTDTAKVLKDIFIKELKGNSEEEVKKYDEMLKDETLTVFKRNIYNEILEKAKVRLELANEVIKENTDPETGNLYYGPANDLLYKIKRDIESEGKIDEYATERAARELVENDPEFHKWAQNKYESVEAKEKIFNGYTPSGNRKYLSHTLENVSKYMRQEAVRGGESFSYGMGSARARVTPKWSMLKDIAKNKNRIVSTEDFNKIKDELEPIYDKYVDICAENLGFDIGEARLNEALEMKNPLSYLKSEYGIAIEDANEFNKFVKDLKAMPTEYFETKFTRPVMLNEFFGAVIPSTANEETKKALEDAGLVVQEYTNDADRLNAIKEIGKNANGMVLFQTVDLTNEFSNISNGNITETNIKNYINSIINQVFDTVTDPLKIQVVNNTKAHVINSNVKLKGARKKRQESALYAVEKIINNAVLKGKSKSVDLTHNTSAKTLNHKQSVLKYYEFETPIRIGNDYFTVLLTTERIKGQKPDILNLYNVNVKKEIPVTTNLIAMQQGQINNNTNTSNVNIIYLQTEQDLRQSAMSFDNWMDFMDFYESALFLEEDEKDAIPKDANASWYQNYWEMVHGINPTTQQREEEVVSFLH